MEALTQSSQGPSTSHLEFLLDRLNAGNESALEDLIRESYPRVLRRTRIILHGDIGPATQGMTEEVCSRSFEKFANAVRKGLKRPLGSLAEMMGYLGPIIRRTAIDEVRTILGPVHQTQFPPTPLVGDPAVRPEQRLRFYEMVEGLPIDEQQVMELRYVFEYSNVEIAQILKIHRLRVALLLSQALGRLSKDYED